MARMERYSGEIENLSQLWPNPDQRIGFRFRVGANANGINGGGKDKEAVEGRRIVRLADFETDKKDAKAIASILNEPQIITHLSEVAPEYTKKKINEFRENIGNYLPEGLKRRVDEERLKEIGSHMFRASPEGVWEYYRKLIKDGAEVYVVEEDGKVVGTATLKNPKSLEAEVSKVAVSSRAKRAPGASAMGKGAAGELLDIIDKRCIELGVNSVEATIIRHKQDLQDGKTPEEREKLAREDMAPILLFNRHGYTFIEVKTESTMAWDFEKKIKDSEEKGGFEFQDQIRVRKKFIYPAAA